MCTGVMDGAVFRNSVCSGPAHFGWVGFRGACAAPLLFSDTYVNTCLRFIINHTAKSVSAGAQPRRIERGVVRQAGVNFASWQKWLLWERVFLPLARKNEQIESQPAYFFTHYKTHTPTATASHVEPIQHGTRTRASPITKSSACDGVRSGKVR